LPTFCKVVAGAAFALLPLSAVAAPESYNLDPQHTFPHFTVVHVGMSHLYGRFDKTSGKMTVDTAAKSGTVDIAIETASVNTGDSDRAGRPRTRDEHLRSPDFFDASAYPKISFTSHKVVALGEGRFAVAGTLSMHGVSRQVTLPVQLLGVSKDPWGGTRAGFATTVTLDRKEYGISWNKSLDAGGYVLGDEVEVDIQLEAILQEAKPAR
jgi:polyisoprenoid-binding protein YceI